MPRPLENEYNSFYKTYIDKVEGDDVVEALESSYIHLEEWLQSLKDKDLSYQYAKEKWSIAQVLQHIIDTERIFAYRAMCIGRGEQQLLPGFDENAYAAAAPASGRKWKGLAEELLTLRKASIILFRSLAKENSLFRNGIASGKPVSVNALGFMMTGHVLHHIKILDERYLKT